MRREFASTAHRLAFEICSDYLPIKIKPFAARLKTECSSEIQSIVALLQKPDPNAMLVTGKFPVFRVRHWLWEVVGAGTRECRQRYYLTAQ